MQSVGAAGGKTKLPILPPFSSKPKGVVPQGRVLERTKSLEDMLSSDGSDKKPSSPLLVKKFNDGPKNNGRSEYDHLEMKPVEPNSSPHLTRKPEPAKKQFHKSASTASEGFRKVNSPPVFPPPNDYTDSPPPLPPPNFSPSQPSKGPFVPKTYLAIESYDSQAPGCLSFNAGDRCILVRQSNGGWWYVNIGGIEGWTPGDFWQEDNTRVSKTIITHCATAACVAIAFNTDLPFKTSQNLSACSYADSISVTIDS